MLNSVVAKAYHGDASAKFGISLPYPFSLIDVIDSLEINVNFCMFSANKNRF